MSDHSNEQESQNAIDLLKGLKSHQINPKSLSREEVLACTDYLTLKGVSAQEIASILVRSDRTIYRYRRTLRKRRRMTFDPEFGSILLGELDSEFQRSVECLKRIADDPLATPRDRVAVMQEINRAMTTRVKLFQSIGWLPTHKATPSEAPQAIGDWRDQLINSLEKKEAVLSAGIELRVRQIQGSLIEEMDPEQTTPSDDEDMGDAA